MQAATFTGRPFAQVAGLARGIAATRQSRTPLRVCAGLEPSAAFAVSQQAVLFAAVVGAEAAFTGLNTPAGTPGRPSVPSVLAVTATTVAGAVLIKQGGDVATAGCAVALGSAALGMLMYGLRVKDTPFNPAEWPGAKATPAVMALLGFFALQAAFQGLRDALGQLG